MSMKEEVCGRRVCAVLAAALAVGLGACATKQVSPVAMQDEKRICIVENPKVLHDFLGAYRRALEARGFQVDVIAPASELSACPVTTTYVGFWRWDLVLYLAHAELQVYKGGQPAGRAVYDAHGSRLGAEGKINDLVDDLFKR
jgi:hypothetical protein